MNLFRKTIVLDVNLIPEEYSPSDRSLKDSIKAYEKDFSVKVIPVDFSRKNLQSSPGFIKKI